VGKLVDRIDTGICLLEVLAETIQFQGLEIGLGRLSGPLSEGIEERSLAGADDLADLEQAQAPVEVGEHVLLGLPDEFRPTLRSRRSRLAKARWDRVAEDRR
jgi:hypothetical protein